MRPRVIYMVPALWCLATPSLATSPEMAAVENQVTLAASFAHTDYREHLFPSNAETGITPDVTASGTLLLSPSTRFD